MKFLYRSVLWFDRNIKPWGENIACIIALIALLAIFGTIAAMFFQFALTKEGALHIGGIFLLMLLIAWMEVGYKKLCRRAQSKLEKKSS